MGNEFIVVHVKIVNNSGSEYNYSLADFHIKSGSGNVTDASVIPPSTYHENNLLAATGKLTTGGSAQGDVILEAPKGDHQAELSWQPNFFGNATDNVWLLAL